MTKLGQQIAIGYYRTKFKVLSAISNRKAAELALPVGGYDTSERRPAGEDDEASIARRLESDRRRIDVGRREVHDGVRTGRC